MPVVIEKHIPDLLKAIQRNGGILDIWAAHRTFGTTLVKLAIAKKEVGKKTIILNSKSAVPLRIPCITLDWDGKRPDWLKHYKKD